MPLEWERLQQVCWEYIGGSSGCFGVMMATLGQANALVEGIQAGQAGAQVQGGNHAEMGSSV